MAGVALMRGLVVAALAAWAGAAEAAAGTPGLVQKPGLAGCFQAAGRGPCAAVRSMMYPQAVTASDRVAADCERVVRRAIPQRR